MMINTNMLLDFKDVFKDTNTYLLEKKSLKASQIFNKKVIAKFTNYT